MRYEFNFGTAGKAGRTAEHKSGAPFRIAILGDFSGRANRGAVEAGADLARRKPMKLDVDTIDGVIGKFKTALALQVGPQGGAVEIELTEIDDLHPDQLFDKLEIFSELADLRKRLDNGKTFKAAAKDLQNWLEARGEAVPAAHSTRSRANALRVDARLSDFAGLIGGPVRRPEASAVEDLIKEVVAPFVVEAASPDQDAMIAAVDAALSRLMRDVLHHPDFQALESAWRSLDFLARRIETDNKMQLVLFDVSADELAADLSAADSIADTGLYQLLIEQPALDAHQGPFSAIIGNYFFEMTPPHAELLARIARLAAHARAPFIAAIGPDCIDTKFDDRHPLVIDAWTALRALPEARFVALATPRFLLRMPYGARSEPIDPFEFEEFDARSGLRAMLWGNPAIVAAVLLAQTRQQTGAKMELGKVLGLDEMPYTFYYDEDGEAVALPCTERMLNERKAANVSAQNFIAMLSIRGRPEVRLAGFQSIAGEELLGPWSAASDLAAAMSSAAPAAAAAIAQEAAAEPPAVSGEASEPESPPDTAEASEPEPAGEAPAEEPAQEAAAADDDLDALLASLGESEQEQPAEAAEEEMDPDLAALLKDL